MVAPLRHSLVLRGAGGVSQQDVWAVVKVVSFLNF